MPERGGPALRLGLRPCPPCTVYDVRFALMLGREAGRHPLTPTRAAGSPNGPET